MVGGLVKNFVPEQGYMRRGFPTVPLPDKSLLVTTITDYASLTGYMDRLGLFHMDLTLDRMSRFWEARAMPDLPLIHVVGTNGKGSTATFLCSIARAHGLKVGTFTSPHFVSPRERIQVNRSPLPRSVWVELGREILATPGGEDLTYFEFQTCLAMLAFERAGVDLAIMEAGLGGTYDATNVFAPGLTLFTPIGMDHEKVLGPTLRDIARDKAGAIRPGGVVITGVQEPEAMVELQERAEAVGARFMYGVDMAEPVLEARLGLAGIHQRVNAHLALAGWRWFSAGIGHKSDTLAELFGLESAFMPGRMQRVELDGQELILDGAHNSHALQALRSALVDRDIRPGAVVFACLADKDAAPMAPLLRDLTDGPVIIPAMQSERACDPARLATLMGEGSVTAVSLDAALRRCRDEAGPILVCGSLYLLAEFFSVYPHFLSPQRSAHP